jgi:hypothetical protein
MFPLFISSQSCLLLATKLPFGTSYSSYISLGSTGKEKKLNFFFTEPQRLQVSSAKGKSQPFQQLLFPLLSWGP